LTYTEATTSKLLISKPGTPYQKHTEFTKEDTIAGNLRKFTIALETLGKYPEAFNEYKKEIRLLRDELETGRRNDFRVTGSL
jgi:hypothetical protein